MRIGYQHVRVLLWDRMPLLWQMLSGGVVQQRVAALMDHFLVCMADLVFSVQG